MHVSDTSNRYYICVVTELPIRQNFKFCQQNFQLEVLSTELPI